MEVNMNKVPKLRFKEFSEDWEKKKLGEVLTERKVKKKISNETPLLAFAAGQGVIDRSERKTNNRDFLTKDSAQKTYLLTKYNDIVYNPSNLKYGAIDRNKYGQGLISPIYVTFETTEIPSFIEEIVKTENFKQRALQYEEGTVVKRQSVKPENLLSLIISKPSKQEQEKIASSLTSVNTKIEQLTKKRELLKQYQKGVMQQIFSQEIRFKADDGSEFNDWKEKKLDEVSQCLDNKRKPLNESERNQMKGDIPYYGANGIVDYVNDFLFEEPLVLLAEDGGNFFEYNTKPIAQKIDGKAWVNNHAHILKAKEKSLITDFLFYSLVHKNITKYIVGGSRAKLNKSDLLSIKIIVPCLEEQTKIANFLSSIDSKIEQVQKQLDSTKEFKKALIKQMFV